MRDVAERLLLDLAVLAIAAAKENGLILLSLIVPTGNGDVYGSFMLWHRE
jgi:hypothetical protein